jgi:uncharacterized protein YceK
MKKVTLLICVFVFLEGCASIATKSDGAIGIPYSGVKMHVQPKCGHGPFSFLFAVFDTPLSFVVDTILLPVDLIADKDPDYGKKYGCHP